MMAVDDGLLREEEQRRRIEEEERRRRIEDDRQRLCHIVVEDLSPATVLLTQLSDDANKKCPPPLPHHTTNIPVKILGI